MKQNLLLLEDVADLGKKGEIVSVKPGYARNFLLPKKKGVVAHKNTIRMQQRLQEEREKQAIVDRKESEELAKKLMDVTLRIEVKVDPEGHLYGSVGVNDVLSLFEQQELPIEKKYIRLKAPIKELGRHTVHLVLKEDVESNVPIEVEPEPGIIIKKKIKKTKEDDEKEKAEELKEAEKQAEDVKEEE